MLEMVDILEYLDVMFCDIVSKTNTNFINNLHATSAQIAQKVVLCLDSWSDRGKCEGIFRCSMSIT